MTMDKATELVGNLFREYNDEGAVGTPLHAALARQLVRHVRAAAAHNAAREDR